MTLNAREEGHSTGIGSNSIPVKKNTDSLMDVAFDLTRLIRNIEGAVDEVDRLLFVGDTVTGGTPGLSEGDSITPVQQDIRDARDRAVSVLLSLENLIGKIK